MEDEDDEDEDDEGDEDDVEGMNAPFSLNPAIHALSLLVYKVPVFLLCTKDCCILESIIHDIN